VVAAYYYIRIVKLMYFDEPADAFDRMPGRELGLIQAAAAAFVLFFFLFPGPLVRAAELAVKSLAG
jgi:NADH-quinone oxidoreductase subunit N